MRRSGSHERAGRVAVTRRLLGLFRPYRLAVVATVLLGLLSTVASLLGPELLGKATDLISAGMVGKSLAPGTSEAQVIAQLRIEGDNTLANVFSTMDLVPGQGVDFGKLAMLLVISMVMFLSGAAFLWSQGRMVATAVQRVLYGLREQVEQKLSRLPLSYFDRTPRGEVLSRVTNDVDNLQQTLQLTVGQTFNMLFTIVGVLAVMLVLSPLLAALVLITVPVSAVLAAVIGKRAQSRFGQQWATTGRLNARIEEVYTGHALVRGFRREIEARREFDECNQALFDAERRAQAITGLIEPSTRFVTDLTYILVAVFGALRVASGTLSIGEVQAFTQYATMLSRPVVSLAGISGQLQSGLASAERIFELLDTPEQRAEVANPVRPHWVRGRVRFDRVSFRYVPDVPLIQDLSLTVEPGQIVAIVGSTGAGKTTLGNLLMRFYEVDHGRIMVDGVDIADMTRDDLRALIGIVPQDPWLFGGTIAENIAYGCPDATPDQIAAAARATCVDRFVHGLPDGYDTVLDDEVATVSAGEKQLITLARAFLARPAVLILDEATSSIDTRTEALIQMAMNSLRQDRTSFVIAHRLSTIRNADMILVMDQGRIVERGTHDQLLDHNGTYATLYHSSQLTASPALRTRDPRSAPLCCDCSRRPGPFRPPILVVYAWVVGLTVRGPMEGKQT
jgi:ATP-binding cassette, subfamily B, multidrug efflux pump